VSGNIPADGLTLSTFHGADFLILFYMDVNPAAAATAPEEVARVAVPIRKSQDVRGLQDRRGD
jgi:hypothetical protein